MLWFQHQWQSCPYWVIIKIICSYSILFVFKFFLNFVCCVNKKTDQPFWIYLLVLFSKLQKSVADLERLYKEKSGVNFVIPSSHLGHEKVFIQACSPIHIPIVYINTCEFTHCFFIIWCCRFQRVNYLWINFVRRNNLAFLIIFPVDLSLTSWLLLTLRVSNAWCFQNVYHFNVFSWLDSEFSHSFKWKSSTTWFLALHWSLWPVEFLPAGKQIVVL